MIAFNIAPHFWSTVNLQWSIFSLYSDQNISASGLLSSLYHFYSSKYVLCAFYTIIFHPNTPLPGFAIFLVPCEHPFFSLPYTVTKNISQESAGDLTRVESHNSAALFYAFSFQKTLAVFSSVYSYPEWRLLVHTFVLKSYLLYVAGSRKHMQESKHLNEISKQNHFSLFQSSTSQYLALLSSVFVY